jgi:3-oxoacid CoA-transferase
LWCRITVVAKTHPTPRLRVACSYSTAAYESPSKFQPQLSKLFKDADEAVSDIKSGSVMLSSGFGLCGVPGKLT